MRSTSDAGRRKIYILGDGVSYSHSPAMHNAAFQALWMDWTYDLLDVSRAQLRGALAERRAQDVGGANVTIPYKQAVMDHLDTIAPDAVRARAVNTIVNDRGRLGGYNTDIPAIRAAIEQVGVEPESVNAVILGAGGAARAAAVAMEGAHLTFVTRHPEEADVLGRKVRWDDPSVAALTRSADVRGHATPVGRCEEVPLRPAALPRAGAVIDLVYVSGGTP